MIIVSGEQEALGLSKQAPERISGYSVVLFRSLAEDGLVEAGGVRVVPMLLGVGVPLSPDLKNRIKLALTAHKVYQSGIV